MGISRQRRGIVVLVNPVGAVKERLRGTERRHHVGRDIAGSFHIEQTHVDARGTRGCVAHAQSQPHRIEGNVSTKGTSFAPRVDAWSATSVTGTSEDSRKDFSRFCGSRRKPLDSNTSALAISRT